MGLSISNTVLREGRFIGGGKFQIREVTFDSSLASGGEAISLNQLGMGGIDAVIDCGGNAAAAGYRFQFIPSTNKLTAFRSAGFTPAGTNGTSSVTGNVSVGGGAAGEPLGITPDSNAGALTKNAATVRTIPISTFLGAAPTAGAQTFSGTPVAAGAMVEATSANLATVTQRFMFIGS